MWWSPFLLSAKALLDAVPCDVDTLHGFDIAASVGATITIIRDYRPWWLPFGLGSWGRIRC